MLQTPDNPAAYARTLFCQASSEYPASITAQGAYIELACRRNGFEPEKLKLELLASQPDVSLTLNAAQAAHQRLRPHRNPRLGERLVRNIIQSDFDCARRLKCLEYEPLVEILISGYRHYHNGAMRRQSVKLRELKLELSVNRKVVNQRFPEGSIMNVLAKYGLNLRYCIEVGQLT